MTILNVSEALTIKLYDSLKEMPADLYQTARQYEVMAAELGQNEAELFGMLRKAENYVVAGMKTEAIEQLHNFQQARLLVLDKFQAGQLDWACHVYSVNDVPVTDYDEDSLTAKISDWSRQGLTQQLIEESLANVKKNSSPSENAIFQSDSGAKI